MLHTSTAKNPQLQLVNSKMRMVAVGVADTGPGLSEECCDLQSLASRRLTPRRRRTERTIPASVFHAHLRPEALNTSSTYPPLVQCRNMLNRDMLDAMAGIKGRQRT
jgi:hypothetical protein